MGPERFRIVGALAPLAGWKVEAALDRDRTPPRPVELAAVPPEVTSDGVALAELLRASELATRVVHPAVQPVLGLVERNGAMALASAGAEGTTLPALLGAGGPLPAALAVLVAGQVARALDAVHRLTSPGERPLVHGAVGPEAVRVAEDGAVLLAGLGRPATGGPADDVAALTRLLGTLNPELPAELEQALAAVAGPGATAAGFWTAIEAAVAPAAPAQLARWMERMAPESAAERQARRRAMALALAEEAEQEPMDEAELAAKVEAAIDRPPLEPPPGQAPRTAPTEATPAGRVPGGAPPRPQAGAEAEGPGWFAPPTAPATPPPLRAPGAARGSTAKSPADRQAAATGAPPPLPSARAGEVAPAAASGSIAGAVPVPRPVVTQAPQPAPATAWPEVARWRAPIVAAAALLGVLLGWLSGR